MSKDDRGRQGPPTVRRPEASSGSVTLPAPDVLAGSRAEESFPAPPKPSAGLGALVPAPSSGPRILVVDDDPDIRETLEAVLTDEGYSVYQARDGFEGLARLTQVPRIEVVLLDLMMTPINGLQFLAEFDKSVYADVPVVILSAYRPGRDDEFERYLSESRVFLGKGANLNPLLDVVRRAIDQGRAVRAAKEGR